MNDALVFKDLHTGYGKHEVLRGLDITLERGKLHAVIGPNGSGKTTLIRTILREISIWNGDLILDGRSIKDLSQKELSRLIGYVPQKAILPESFTVDEVLDMVSFSFSGISQDIIRKAEEQCGISHLSSRRISELSGGEVQLVLLARCLCTNSPIVLLDEVSNNLDIRNHSKLLKLVKELTGEGKTILMVAHDLNAVLRYADDVTLLVDGRVHSFGKPEEIITEEMIQSVFGSRARIAQTKDGESVIIL